MSCIVLAVPKRALAVLPGLAPVDGRQRDEYACATTRIRAPGGKRRPSFERMLARGVMRDALRVDQIGLGRMQISTRRVDPEGPTRGSILLPCRQAHPASQPIGDRVGVHRN